jgi:alpha-1,2-mannosyltransferase
MIQPHKEERFMYVIYPLICYNAALAVAAFTQIVGVLSGPRLGPSLSRAIVTFLLWSVFTIFAILSLARVLAQVRAFSSCMHVYGHLEGSSTVCLGKEWYRFPSSFFVPKGGQALFVKSAFDGLLPGRFPEQEARTGWRSGTWQVPEGMNDRNLEETSHHVRISNETSHS